MRRHPSLRTCYLNYKRKACRNERTYDRLGIQLSGKNACLVGGRSWVWFCAHTPSYKLLEKPGNALVIAAMAV